jgi:hypothetical protein
VIALSKLISSGFWISMQVTMVASFVSVGPQMANMSSLVAKMTWSQFGLLPNLLS